MKYLIVIGWEDQLYTLGGSPYDRRNGELKVGDVVTLEGIRTSYGGFKGMHATTLPYATSEVRFVDADGITRIFFILLEIFEKIAQKIDE